MFGMNVSFLFAKPFNLLIYWILFTFGLAAFCTRSPDVRSAVVIVYVGCHGVHSLGSLATSYSTSVPCLPIHYIKLSFIIGNNNQRRSNFLLFRKVCQKAFSLCKMLCGTAVIHWTLVNVLNIVNIAGVKYQLNIVINSNNRKKIKQIILCPAGMGLISVLVFLETEARIWKFNHLRPSWTRKSLLVENSFLKQVKVVEMISFERHVHESVVDKSIAMSFMIICLFIKNWQKNRRVTENQNNWELWP